MLRRSVRASLMGRPLTDSIRQDDHRLAWAQATKWLDPTTRGQTSHLQIDFPDDPDGPSIKA